MLLYLYRGIRLLINHASCQRHRITFQELVIIAFTFYVLSHYTFHHHLDSTVVVMCVCGYIIYAQVSQPIYKPSVASCSASGLHQSTSIL